MNAIFFGVKRAFHGILRVTRRPLASLGLTAARFDMLHALLKCHSDCEPYRCEQSELRRTLGVTAPTVSRMLRSLEALGLVTRRRPEFGDQRQRLIALTEAGLQCIRYACKAIMRASWRLLHYAISFGKHRDRNARFAHTCNLEDYLRALRSDYGDTATLSYPWHPDD